MKDISKRLESLKAAYKDKADALEEIQRAETTINYYLQQGLTEKAIAHINQLDAFLFDWY